MAERLSLVGSGVLTPPVRLHRFCIRTLVLTLTLLVGSRRAMSDTVVGSAISSDQSAINARAAQPPSGPGLFKRDDLLLLGAAVGGVTLAVFNDSWLTDEAIEGENIPTLERSAKFFEPFGSPAVILPTAAALYVIGRWGGRPQLARRASRGGFAVIAAGAVVVGLKEVFGRERPYESPGHPFRFKSFSGHTSFPSGHSAIAFAAAAEIDRETTSRWIPFLVYPAATLVAWSRVHDQQHWTSDVVAGAAIGGWTAWKTGGFLERRDLRSRSGRTSLFIAPRDGCIELVVGRRF
jgi:membrane-associated phospholipid phosphatase